MENENKLAVRFPALFSNRFYVHNCGPIVRLSFGEALNGQEALHTGIVLLRQDAVALRDLLTRLLEVPPLELPPPTVM